MNTRRYSKFLAGVFASLILLSLLISPGLAAAGDTLRVSVASDGTQGNGDSSWFTEPHFSGDGRYIVFASSASNLVPDDTNGSADVFIHDRQTSQTTRISVASDGTQANGGSGGPSISADGRYVAFHSIASNLVDGDTNNNLDVFVHDRWNGETIRVSVASDGSQGDGYYGYSLWPSFSADGRYVAFTSRASNLVPGDTNPGCEYSPTPGECADIFVHDRFTGQTTRVSVATDGTQANADSYSVPPTISTDGRYVAFESVASTLVPNDTNSSSDVFVHDRQTGQTTRVSVTSDGMQANSISAAPSISGDGRYIAFWSAASNLVSGRSDWGIYVHDMLTGQTTFASLASDGTSIYGVDGDTAISTDGRFVAFEAFDATVGVYALYLRDLVAARTTRISVAFNGGQANGTSRFPGLSADGRYVGFTSQADNIVQGDTNGYADVFVRENDIPIAPFLDLPFQDTNFSEAANGYYGGTSPARVMSWFDHSTKCRP